MSLLAEPPPTPEGVPEPVWEMATLYPPQGKWTVEDYFELDQRTNRQIEYIDGRVEFLPVPTAQHDEWSFFMRSELASYLRGRNLGRVHSAPTPVGTFPEHYREPDVFVATGYEERPAGSYPKTVPFAVEIVSPDEKSRRRDQVEKRAEYAAAGIAEYWIVDPDPRAVTVLTLPEGAAEYVEHGVFAEGETATSVLLEGFVVDVAELFAAAE